MALASWLTLGLVFCASLVVGVVIHGGTGISRRVLRSLVNDILAAELQGSLRIGSIERLGPDRIEVADVSIDDPDGNRVLTAEGISLDGGWFRSLLALGLHGGASTLVLPSVRIARGEVDLARVGDDLALELALRSKPKPRKTATPPKAPSPSRFGLSLADIAIGEVRVHGSPAPGVTIDGRVAELRAGLWLSAERFTLDVHDCLVEERALAPVAWEGRVGYHLRAYPAVTDPGSGDALRPDPPGGEAAAARADMWGSFAGDFGGTGIETEVQWIDGRLSLSLSLPRLSPDRLRLLLPDSPLRVPASIRLWAGGDVGRIDVRAQIALDGLDGGEAGLLLASGSLQPAEPLLFESQIEAAALDLRAFAAQAPHSRIGARARLLGRVQDGGVALRLALSTRPSEVAGQQLPAVEGTIAWSEAGGSAALVIDEPGARSDVELRLEQGSALGLSLRSDVAELARVPRLQELLRAASIPISGRLRLDGEGRLDGDQLELSATIDAVGVALPSAKLRVGRTRVRGRLSGALDSLQIDAHGRAAVLRLDERSLESLDLGVLGPLRQPTVRVLLRDDDRRELEAKAVVDPVGVQLHHASVELRRDSTSLGGTVERVGRDGSGVRIDGIALRGLGGDVSGALRVVDGEIVGKLEAHDLDLSPLSKLAGLPYRLRGRAALDVDLARDQSGRKGHVRLDLEDGGMLVIGGIDLSVAAQFEGAQMRPEVTLSLSAEHLSSDASADPCAGPIATIRLREGDLGLAGRLLEPATWRDLDGRATLAVEGVKLPCLAEVAQQVMPGTPLALERRDGVVDATVDLVRPRGQKWPSLEGLRIRSRGLALAPPKADGSKDQPPPWSSEHLDVDLQGRFDGSSREGHLELRLLDRLTGDSEVGRLVLDASVDVEELLAGSARARAAAEQMPVSAHLQVPRLGLARGRALPQPLAEAVTEVAGDVEINAYMEGTVRDPSLGFRVRTWGLGPADRGPDWDLRTDMDVIGSYHAGIGRIDAHIARKGRTIATLAGESRGNLSARLLGGSDPRWTGWIEARLLGLPLESLPPLDDLGLAGELSGLIAVRGLGEAPRVDVSLTSPALKVGDQLVLDNPSLSIAPIEGQPGGLTLESNLPVRGGGRMDLRGYGTVSWQDALYPKPDLDRPAAFYAVAKGFPIGVLKPALGEEVTRLDGRLDGELRLSYREFYERELAFDVDMKLSEGVLHIPAFGQELHSIGAHVTSTPGLVRIEDITASSSGGRAQGWLLARTKGSELALRDLTGALSIAPGEPMPLVLEGMSVGTVSGTLMLNATPQPAEAGGALDVKLTAAGLHIQLPPTAAHGVQDLSDHPDVNISRPVAPPELEKADKTIPLSVTIALANAEIEGSQLRILFGTNPERPVKISIDREVDGELQLSGGELNLLDKTFSIDRGVVRLDKANPGNPYVNVTAHWAAPEGTVVYVDYIGQLLPLSREKIRFHSDPPRSEGELLALLVFGEVQSTSGRDSGANDRAGGLGRGIAASQFNAILGEVAPGLSTSLASSDGYVSTTVTYRFSDRVSASATYENVSSTGGTSQTTDPAAGNTNTTTSTETTSRTKLSVDWRFAPSWLLRGTFGLGEGASSGVDLLFQHRYE